MEKILDGVSTCQLKRRSCGKRLPEDHLSSLSDDVLLFVLSFLPFKEVVKTSLLSRRWLNLWMHTLVLHYHAPVSEETPTDRKRRHYVKWINRLLRRHKGHRLKEFRIVCDLDKRHQKDIDIWMAYALAKKVECLELNFLCSGKHLVHLHENYVLPGRFLNFGSGEANLDGGKYQFSQIDLKCLKSLSLKSVAVTSEAINFILLNCPFLERLEVVGSLSLVNLVISDPNLVLKYLMIKSCVNFEVLSISNFNLVSLAISAVEDLSLKDLPMLVELFIVGPSDKLIHSISQASFVFFQLEALILRNLKPQDVNRVSYFDQLTKLKRLTLHMGARDNESLTAYVSIINSCPRLEECVFMLNWYSPKRTRRNIRKVETHSSSLKNKSLKVFEFVGYYGRVSDDELVMHVVANAVGLEKIIIYPRDAIYIDCHEDLTKEEEEARTIALQKYEYFNGFVPPHVHLLIR